MGPKTNLQGTAWLAALTCLLTVASSGCASLSAGTYNDAVARWRLGDPASAVASARQMYAKFRDDNGLSEAAVVKATDEALETLETMPVLTKAVAPRPLPEGPTGNPDELVMELRRDMLSPHVTAVIRATSVVRDFGLTGEYPTLLAIIYRTEPLRADGGVLVGANTALRSIVAKLAALRVLERFAAGIRGRSAGP